jgi:hypothetical protein
MRGLIGLTGRVRHWYGAHPLHLLALLAVFALAGYALRAVVAAGQWRGFAVWFVVAIVAHDLLLFPLYSLADLSLRRLLPARAGGEHSRLTAAAGAAGRADTAGPAGTAGAAPPPSGPPVINYVRVPAAFALLLLLVWFPLILGLSAGTYHRASGLTAEPYLGRWLAVTGVLFLASAAAYAVALRRASARARARKTTVLAGRGR